MRYKHTELSRPSVSNIMKNNSDQNVAPGNVAMASGYTTNTKPGPEVNDRVVNITRPHAHLGMHAHTHALIDARTHRCTH